MKFTHWVRVKVTGYYHTSILSTTVAYPDKVARPMEMDPEWQTIWDGESRVVDQGVDL